MRFNWKSSIVLCTSLFILYLLITYWGAFTGLIGIIFASASTLLIGAAAAYVVNILMSFYERKIAPNCSHALWVKNRRVVCMLLAVLTVVLAIVLLVQLIVPQLLQCFQVLLSALPGAFRSLYSYLEEHLNISTILQEQNLSLPATDSEWRTLIEKGAKLLLSGVGGVMNAAVSVTSSLVTTVITLFMSVIFMINILLGKEKIASQFSRLFRRLLGNKVMNNVDHVLHVVDECFHNYIVGQLIEALILGGLCALGMWILQLPYHIMIGALIGVMALIPIAGAYIGAAVGAIMIFSVSPVKALVFLIFLIILQQIEGNLIYPHTVGNTIHLPGIWVLAAVSIGGGVMGILGMIIFVPIAAALYRLLGEWVRKPGKDLIAVVAAVDDDFEGPLSISVQPPELIAPAQTAPEAAPAPSAPQPQKTSAGRKPNRKKR